MPFSAAALKRPGITILVSTIVWTSWECYKHWSLPERLLIVETNVDLPSQASANHPLTEELFLAQTCHRPPNKCLAQSIGTCWSLPLPFGDQYPHIRLCENPKEVLLLPRAVGPGNTPVKVSHKLPVVSDFFGVPAAKLN
jgi:hypothetical protein